MSHNIGRISHPVVLHRNDIHQHTVLVRKNDIALCTQLRVCKKFCVPLEGPLMARSSYTHILTACRKAVTRNAQTATHCGSTQMLTACLKAETGIV